MKRKLKFNLGGLVFICVIAAVIVYLVVLTVERRNDRPDIIDMCEDFAETLEEFCRIPENVKTEEDVKAYVPGLKEKIKATDSANLTSLNRSLTDFFCKELAYGIRISDVSISLEYTGFGDFTIEYLEDQSSVKLTFELETRVEYESMPNYDRIYSTMKLKKIDGEWYISDVISFGDVVPDYFFDQYFYKYEEEKKYLSDPDYAYDSVVFD